MFTERGYDAATLRHIAREVGVDTRMVRHNLVDRAGLFRAAMDRVSPVAVLAVAAMTLGTGTGTELLDGWRDMRRNAMRSPRRK
jgi:AcrR family transcriptional regulator